MEKCTKGSTAHALGRASNRARARLLARFEDSKHSKNTCCERFFAPIPSTGSSAPFIEVYALFTFSCHFPRLARCLGSSGLCLASAAVSGQRHTTLDASPLAQAKNGVFSPRLGLFWGFWQLFSAFFHFPFDILSKSVYNRRKPLTEGA